MPKQKKDHKFLFRGRMKSFAYAFEGLKILYHEEHNFRIHIVVATLAIIGGFVFNITPFEWIAVVFAAGFVFVTEILNTAIENITDFISPGKDKHIKKVKDLSAAAVLVSAIISVIVGLIVFLPYAF